jgi:hypothetical protein
MVRQAFLRALYLLLTATVVATGGAVYAWNAPGHRDVGSVADRLIEGQRAERQVRAILGDVTLAQAGPWGDCVRSITGPDKGFQYKPEEQYRPPCRVFETPERMRQMESYVRTNWSNCDYDGRDGCHTQYHFVNMALQGPGYRFGNVGTHKYDIIQAMNAAVAVLRTPACSRSRPATGRVRAPGVFRFTCPQALMMLVHLMGDLHQPLHVGSVYLDESGRLVDPDSSDAERVRATQTKVTFTFGGNSLAWSGRKLHSVWDDAPDGPFAARRVAVPSEPMSEWPRLWANDTLAEARLAYTGIHFDPKQGREWPVIFDDPDYQSHREAMQRRQIEKGGARLALLLMAIWPGR